jgi:hypothetical protein
MDDSLFRIFGQVAGIGGLALGVLMVLYREVIRRRIFPQLSQDQAYRVIRLIVVLTWTVALVGVGSWVYTSRPQHDDRSDPISFGPPIPFQTGWIFIGYYNQDKQVFVEGPTASVTFRPTSGERGQLIPKIGDILRVQKDRNVMIANYKTAGLKYQLTSPPLVKDPLSDDDETGVRLKENSMIVVRDVELSGYPDHSASIWARVASCDMQTEACRKANDAR